MSDFQSRPTELALSRAEQIARLHAWSGDQPEILSVVLEPLLKKRHRRFFSSDEEYEKAAARVAIYEAEAGTFELTYGTPFSRWTGNDLDRLIHDVIDLMDARRCLPEDEAYNTHWWPYFRRGTARSVMIERTTRGRKHLYTRNSLSIFSAIAPYKASVELPEPIQAIALATILDIHGQCDFQIDLRSNLPYEPLTSGGAR